jgi:hypothetical protein
MTPPFRDQPLGICSSVAARRYDESTFFSDATAEFVVSHVPWSAGFLVLRKLATPFAPTP